MPALFALAACEPDIGSGAYYCGPERACPPDLRCDESTAVCRFAAEVQPFLCAEGANDHEPDDTLATAHELGEVGCGVSTVVLEGCIDGAADVDHLAIRTPEGCAVPVQVVVQAPIAFASVALEVLAPDGTPVVAGTVCDDVDGTGLVHVCADLDVPGGSAFVVRVQLLGDDGACDGACAYNRYHLSIH